VGDYYVEALPQQPWLHGGELLVFHAQRQSHRVRLDVATTTMTA